MSTIRRSPRHCARSGERTGERPGQRPGGAGAPLPGTTRPDRADRLEILTALITGPSFDPVFRPDVIKIPRDHPVFRWNCLVRDCERVRSGGTGLCKTHCEEYAQARSAGAGMVAFLDKAEAPASEWMEETACRLCPGRPAAHTRLRLCLRHQQRWAHHHAAQPGEADFSAWLAGEQAYPGFGNCTAAVCPSMAATAIGLCSTHFTIIRRTGGPAGPRHPDTAPASTRRTAHRCLSFTPMRRRSAAGAHRRHRCSGRGRST